MTRTKDQAAAVLPTLLKALRLPSINRNWKRLTDTADRDGWPAANLLASLLEIEMADRSSRRIQRHRDQSGLPAGKPFATFDFDAAPGIRKPHLLRSEEHTSELQSLMRISYAVFCLKQNNKQKRSKE